MAGLASVCRPLCWFCCSWASEINARQVSLSWRRTSECRVWQKVFWKSDAATSSSKSSWCSVFCVFFTTRDCRWCSLVKDNKLGNSFSRPGRSWLIHLRSDVSMSSSLGTFKASDCRQISKSFTYTKEQKHWFHLILPEVYKVLLILVCMPSMIEIFWKYSDEKLFLLPMG